MESLLVGGRVSEEGQGPLSGEEGRRGRHGHWKQEGVNVGGEMQTEDAPGGRMNAESPLRCLGPRQLTEIMKQGPPKTYRHISGSELPRRKTHPTSPIFLP